MSNRVDLLLDKNNQVYADPLTGDFAFGYADGQNGQLLLLSEKGSWRQWPLVGVGLRKMTNMKLLPLSILSLKKEITQQFNGDGCKITSLTIPNSVLTGAESINIKYQ